VAADDKYDQYYDYAKKMATIGRTTEWHETQQKYEVSKANKRNETEIKKELE
jgi:hypothetical protein